VNEKSIEMKMDENYIDLIDKTIIVSIKCGWLVTIMFGWPIKVDA